MQSRIRGTVLAAVAMAVCAPLVPGSAADEEELVAGELGRRLDVYLERLAGFEYAGAAIVSKDDEVVLRKGYGLADRESGRAVAAHTVFTIGSITKQFTGAAILRLEMDGQLAVEDPITEFFEEVPADKRDITLHHLLTHTAGLPGAIGDDFENPSREAFLRQALATPLLFEPGERHEYSNVGYSLAAIVIELVSGQSYEEFLREQLFLPAGMERTGYLLAGHEPDQVAVGYAGSERWGTFLERESFTSGPSWNLKGNGGIQSTVGDMLRWHRALGGGEILSADALAQVQARHVDEGYGDSWYGYGWVNFETPRGTRLLAHNGGNGIFSADFRRYVDDGIVVFATSSSSDFFIDPISEDLSRIALGGQVDLPPQVVALEDAQLDALTGSYSLPCGDRILVERERGHLRLSADGERAEALTAGLPPEGADERAQALAQRTLAIVEQWIGGDASGLHRAMGGAVPLEELEAGLAEFRAMGEDAHGELRSASIHSARPAGGVLRVTVALHHARARAYAALSWEGGELVDIEPLREPAAASLSIFPIAEDEFVSFDQRSPDRLRLRFRSGDGAAPALVFVLPSGEYELTR